MKKLPIGISTLENIRSSEYDYVYIDKTHHISNLIKNGGKYFFCLGSVVLASLY